MLTRAPPADVPLSPSPGTTGQQPATPGGLGQQTMAARRVARGQSYLGQHAAADRCQPVGTGRKADHGGVR